MEGDSMMWHRVIPLRGKPKARPRVTSRGVHMPQEYQDWREMFGHLLRAERAPTFGAAPVEVHLEFDTDEVAITIQEIPDAHRPTHVRGDIDNLIGGVLEVLEDIHVVDNDKQIVKVIATVVKRGLGTDTEQDS